MPGRPHAIACTKPIEIGSTSGVMPMSGNTQSTCAMLVMSTTASASTSHQDWRA